MQQEHFIQCIHGGHRKNIDGSDLLNELRLSKSEQIHLLICFLFTGRKNVLSDTVLIDIVDLQPGLDLLRARNNCTGDTGQTGHINTKALIRAA